MEDEQQMSKLNEDEEKDHVAMETFSSITLINGKDENLDQSTSKTSPCPPTNLIQDLKEEVDCEDMQDGRETDVLKTTNEPPTAASDSSWKTTKQVCYLPFFNCNKTVSKTFLICLPDTFRMIKLSTFLRCS